MQPYRDEGGFTRAFQNLVLSFFIGFVNVNSGLLSSPSVASE